MASSSSPSGPWYLGVAGVRCGVLVPELPNKLNQWSVSLSQLESLGWKLVLFLSHVLIGWAHNLVDPIREARFQEMWA
eukprot:3164826-Amphidinium_carterae.1